MCVNLTNASVQNGTDAAKTFGHLLACRPPIRSSSSALPAGSEARFASDVAPAGRRPPIGLFWPWMASSSHLERTGQSSATADVSPKWVNPAETSHSRLSQESAEFRIPPGHPFRAAIIKGIPMTSKDEVAFAAALARSLAGKTPTGPIPTRPHPDMSNQVVRQRYAQYARVLTTLLADMKGRRDDRELYELLQLPYTLVGVRLGHVADPSEVTDRSRKRHRTAWSLSCGPAGASRRGFSWPHEATRQGCRGRRSARGMDPGALRRRRTRESQFLELASPTPLSR